MTSIKFFSVLLKTKTPAKNIIIENNNEYKTPNKSKVPLPKKAYLKKSKILVNGFKYIK